MSLVEATLSYGRKQNGDQFVEYASFCSLSSAIGWAARWLRNHPGSAQLPKSWRTWDIKQRAEWLSSIPGITFSFVSKPIHQILLVHEKHGTRYFYVPEEKDINAVALKIVQERHQNSYYPAPDEQDEPDVAEEVIATLPKTVQRAAIQAWERYRRDKDERQRQQDDFDLAEAAVEQNDGEKAWELLKLRSEYEYERCELVTCESFYPIDVPSDSATEIARLRDDIETAWGIIANAHHGDWERASQDWRKAAECWRDEAWHRIALTRRAQEHETIKQQNGE